MKIIKIKYCVSISILITLFLCELSLAQKTLFDLEPNNKPENAQTFRAEHLLKGSLQEGDQDLFLWDLSDAAADYFWDLELTGIPGRLTQVDIMRLEFTDNGQGVTQVHKLLAIRHFDGLDTVIKHDLIFTPGKYYIGLSFADDPSFKQSDRPFDDALSNISEIPDEKQLLTSGIKIAEQNNYTLAFKKMNKINTLRVKKDNNLSQPTSLSMDRPHGLFMTEEDQWLSFKIKEKQSKNNWHITGSASVGNNIHLTLFDSTQKQLADVASDSEGHFSLKDLNFPIGDYTLKIHSNTPNNLASIAINTSGIAIEGNESEPNNYLKTANKINLDQPILGKQNNNNDIDYFSFDITEEQSGNNIGIELSNINKTNIQFCLKDFLGSNLKCLENKDDIKFNHLALTTGQYYLYVYRGNIESTYEINVNDLGKRKKMQEAEPNDRYEHAAIMTKKRLIRGQFDGDEFDYFKFEVTEKPQLWTIQANGGDIRDITIYDAGKNAIQSMSYSSNNKRARLSNLFLMPGKHVVSLRGNKGKYLLRAFPTGDPDPNFEFEPNDDKSRSQLIKFGVTKKGILSENADTDMYRFSLDNEERIELVIKPPSDGSMRYLLSWFSNYIADKTSKIGEEMIFRGLLNAGDYFLNLRPAGSLTSDYAYSIELKRLPRYGCLQDCEPNDNHQQANKITLKSHIKGKNKTHGDEDWYELPAFDVETKLSFENINPGTYQYFQVHNNSGKKSITLKPIKDENNKLLTHFTIPAGVVPSIRIYGEEENYDYLIYVNDELTSLDFDTDLGIELKIDSLPEEVAAYHHYAQKISGNLSLINPTDMDKQLSIKASTSNFKWQILKLPETVELNAKQKLNLPFEVIVAKKTNGLKSARINIALIDNENKVSQTWQDIKVSGQVMPVNSHLDLSLPKSLQGGINLANKYLGGQITDDDKERLIGKLGRGFEVLFDGYGFKGFGMIYRKKLNNNQDFITIKLANKDNVDVVGIILNPSSDTYPEYYLKDFELQLSNDGVNFQSALKGQLKPIDTEQAFELEKNTSASYARLLFLSNQSGDNNKNIGLGEWKVIAAPESNVLNGQGFNIADPSLGGHVVWSDPEVSGSWNSSIINSDERSNYVRSNSNNDWQWVIGFHNQRAAKINSFKWRKPISSGENKTFEKVSVSIAKESPTGPWESIGAYDLSSIENTIELEQSVWARYVKFSVGNVKPKEYRYPPELIEIFEIPVNQEYYSILGEWGELSEQAIYEKTTFQMKRQNMKTDVNNNSKSTALVLSASLLVNGQVQLEESDKPDWYQYTIPAGENTLYITLQGQPTVSTILSIEDDGGETVPYIKDVSKIGQVNYQATVNAGKTYFIKVEEPARSVIFSWDTSGSTSRYHSVIFHAISQFTEDVIPNRDTVNFLPFGGSLLMEKWYGEPYLLKTILNNYDRKDNSSDAEKTIAHASKALSKRQGSKSIVLITDALTPRDKSLWQQLSTVKPRIFSIGLIAGGSDDTHENQFDIMQSWSRVNNGEFDRITTNADLEITFDKAASKLRLPANYILNVNSEFLKAPGPGSLIITQKLQSSPAAVELILDASGSMLKRLNGNRRINIAKEVLIKTVTEVIPANTPVALRVFGDQQANSCRTDLRLPLAPLNPTKAKSTIEKVNAKNLAKTPIAASLAKVSSDLKKHKGKKIVILLTDGEETCDGDPEKIIKSMIDKGLDIRLNIVGFAINNEELKAEFNHWSQQGNGKYFDSDNPTSLKNSIDEALRTPYSVFSLAGELIAEGTVNGEALKLPAGFYDIKIYGNDIISHTKYQIKGEVEQSIDL